MKMIPSSPSLLSRLTWRQRCLAAGLAIAAILAVQPLLTSAEPAGRKLEVLILGNEGEVHAIEKTTALVVPALSKEGINCFYSTTTADLNSQNLAKYDALLLNGKYDALTPAQEKLCSIS